MTSACKMATASLLSVLYTMLTFCACGKLNRIPQSNVTAILNALLNGYDSQLRPGFGGTPTVVKTDIMVRSMGPISEVDMTYSMDAYFRQTWVDKRLQFHGHLPEMAVHIKMLERIWKPDTFFYNGQGSYMHTITTPNKLLRIKQDGTILYSMRLTIKASCPMYLHYFPVDQQQCPLQLGSYAYTTDQVLYVWKRGAADSIKIAQGMTLSQFDLVGHPASNATIRNRSGEYSTLKVNFKLQRHMGYFLIQVYVPCTLIVILSWVSFWINREATADRIGLGITTVLTLTTLSMDTRTDLPKVPYATALDMFVIMCFVFVTASMLEFAGVHYFTKLGSGEVNIGVNSDDEEDEDDEEYEDEEEEDVTYGGGGEWTTQQTHMGSRTPSAYIHTTSYNNHNVGFRTRIATMQPASHMHSSQYPSHTSHSTAYRHPNTSGSTAYRHANTSGSNAHQHQPQPSSRQKNPSGNNKQPDIESHNKDNCLYKFLKCLQYDHSYKKMMMKKANPVGQNSTSQIDRIARVFFPFSFICCNALYWISYFR